MKRNQRLVGTLVLVFPLFFARSAWADSSDTFSVVAGVNVMHDDNLFRLSSSTDPQSVLGKSTKAEDITVSSLTFKIDKPYSLQRFELEASLIDYRYRTFDYLNYSTEPYNAAWRWSITPNLHGNLTTSRTQSANNFSDYTGYTSSNVHTDKQTGFDGVFDLNASWHLLGGLYKSTSSNTRVTDGQSDSRSETTEAGLRYTFPSGSAFSYIARNTRGDFTNRPDPILVGLIDNRFDDRENEFRLIWPITGKTSIDARLAQFERTNPHYEARDFSGTKGNLNLTWNITGKSALVASLQRDLGSYQTFSSSYTQTDRFRLMPSWQISAKTALRGQFDYARQDYLGAIAQTPANNRSDTLRTAMIALDWQPYRFVSISTSLQRETRASNQPNLDFVSNSISLNAQFSF